MKSATSTTIPDKYTSLEPLEIQERTKKAKESLKDDVLILAHNYQIDEIVAFADFTGDSLELAKISTQTNHKHIVFCGVNFMAESTEILNNGEKFVTLPNLEAGCALAEMASLKSVTKAWNYLSDCKVGKPDSKSRKLDSKSRKYSGLVPIAYINCSAEIKAFCGKHGGYTCTSSNAQKIIKHLLNEDKQILFLPDENLGTNSALLLGLDESQVSQWNWHENSLIGQPDNPIIVWKGYCPVHTPFSIDDIKRLKKETPDISILVHPECLPDVVKQAEYVGSTSQIIKTISEAKPGSKWAIGTEVNLVHRLRDEHTDKEIQLLKSFSCACSYMARIQPEYLLWNLESLVDGTIVNRITVDNQIANDAKIALNRMLDFTHA